MSYTSTYSYGEAGPPGRGGCVRGPPARSRGLQTAPTPSIVKSLFDIAGAATFGVGSAVGRLGGVVTCLSQASLVVDLGAIAPRTGARFARNVVQPVTRVTNLGSVGLQAPSVFDLYSRVTAALRQSGQPSPSPVSPRTRYMGGGGRYAI